MTKKYTKKQIEEWKRDEQRHAHKDILSGLKGKDRERMAKRLADGSAGEAAARAFDGYLSRSEHGAVYTDRRGVFGTLNDLRKMLKGKKK